jgi:hypothetical protein
MPVIAAFVNLAIAVVVDAVAADLVDRIRGLTHDRAVRACGLACTARADIVGHAREA